MQWASTLDPIFYLYNLYTLSSQSVQIEERGIVQNTIYMFVMCYQPKLSQPVNITKDTELYYPFGN